MDFVDRYVNFDVKSKVIKAIPSIDLIKTLLALTQCVRHVHDVVTLVFLVVQYSAVSTDGVQTFLAEKV